MFNRHGLSRSILDPIKRFVRQRSKFGCVVCRAGIYDYEHIEPEFRDATTHDPDGICCLCSSCHTKVTRRQYSKAYVKEKYKEVEAADVAVVPSPYDQLDFHEGKAELKIGGISYDPGVSSVVNYHGQEIFSISPSNGVETAGISALFLDNDGNKTLRIQDNVWQGAMEAWDTEVVGPRIKVRKKKGMFAVVLRLEPPGRIVVERLDMRIGNAHILVSETSYAVGRYNDKKDIYWFHATMAHMGQPMAGASAIEFLTDYEAEWRDQQWKDRRTGMRMATPNDQLVIQTGLGVANKPLGIIIGAKCLHFGFGQLASGGPRNLGKMRQLVFNAPDKVAEYIGTGTY